MPNEKKIKFFYFCKFRVERKKLKNTDGEKCNVLLQNGSISLGQKGSLIPDPPSIQ
jgi:hypothetical protein